MPKVNDELATKVVKAIQEHYYSETPPPTFVIVDKSSIRQLGAQGRSFMARVSIEVEAGTGALKSHTVLIRFRVTERGKVVGNSIEHLPQP